MFNPSVFEIVIMWLENTCITFSDQSELGIMWLCRNVLGIIDLHGSYTILCIKSINIYSSIDLIAWFLSLKLMIESLRFRAAILQIPLTDQNRRKQSSVNRVATCLFSIWIHKRRSCVRKFPTLAIISLYDYFRYV